MDRSKTINNFENYAITKDGVVFNRSTRRILKPDVNSCGYERVTLSKNGNTARFFVHRLVAETFLGFQEGMEVNHINGDKLDNRVNNLEWCTSSSNKQHALSLELRASGEKHVNSKLTDDEVRDICSYISHGFQRGEVLELVPSCSKHQFDDIRRRKTWKQISRDYYW